MTFEQLTKLAKRAKRASADLAVLSTKKKNAVLTDLANELVRNSSRIIKDNAKDVKAAEKKGLSPALIDRLVLNDKRIQGMAAAIREVVALKDPVGDVVSDYKHNGLHIKRVRVPLGVICMIYESRPNVTIDAASLCFKSGNAVILRGGSEAFHSSKELVRIMGLVLKKHGLDPSVVTLVPDTDRRSMISLLKMDDLIDIVIPRGGGGLMSFVKEHSKIPIIKHDKGVCSIFVDESADLKKSINVILNAKMHRPGVCNALETLYVHRGVVKKILPELGEKLRDQGVEIRGDAGVKKILSYAKRATESDYGAEYLDLILAIKIVKNIEDAIANIRKYYSRHTESILTENPANAERFLNALDSSCVMHNTSTRFNDGGELGLGAEIGISTTKLHAYGPMGLAELTITRFVVDSFYRIRN